MNCHLSSNTGFAGQTIAKMADKMAVAYQFAFVDTYHPVSSKFHIWTTFIKLLVMSKYGFCPMNYYQVCRQNRYPLFTAGHYVGALCRSPTVLVKQLSR